MKLQLQLQLQPQFQQLLAALTLAAASTFVQAQAWPAKPVKIIVPYPPGGAVDVVMRWVNGSRWPNGTANPTAASS